MNYLDTSALIKRFVTERGSALVQTIVTRNGIVATAKIAYAEVYAGFTRKQREGHLPDTGPAGCAWWACCSPSRMISCGSPCAKSRSGIIKKIAGNQNRLTVLPILFHPPEGV